VSSAQRKARNFFSLASARVISKILAFVVIAYLARTLGPEQFGVLSFVQTVLTYGVLCSNLGLKDLGTRRIANGSGDISDHVNEILSLRLVLATAIYVVLLAMMSVYRGGVYLLAFVVFGVSLYGTAIRLDWVFNGLEKMEFTAGAETMRYVLYAGLVFALVREPSDLLLVGGIYVLSRFVPSLFLLGSWLRRTTSHRFGIRRSTWRRSLRQAVPIGLSIVFSQLYLNIDIVMTELLLGATAVGWYSAATRVVMAITGVGNLLSVSLFPVLVRNYTDESRDAGRVVDTAVKILLVVFLPIAVGGTLIASEFVETIYGTAYAESVLPFEILIWAGVPITLVFLLNKFLISAESERAAMAVSFVGCVVNIVLNVPLIRWLGLAGPAVATIITEVVVLGGVYYYARSLVEMRLLTQAVRPLIAALAMGGVVWVAMWNLGLSNVRFAAAVYVLVGVVAYPIALFAVGGFDREELDFLRRALG
jgi:O-antigen/teichoic acid export membrane protein